MTFKREHWTPTAITMLPILAAGFAGWVNIKTDVDVLKSAKAAESRQIQSLSEDVRAQGTGQAVIAQRVKSIEALQMLCEEIFGPYVVFENSKYIVSIEGEPEHLVHEIMAFYYAVYLLSDREQDVVRQKGIKLLKQYSRHKGCARFDMPFSRITLKNSTDML